MNRKADALQHKAWDASALSLGPALASTCVTRNLEVWGQRLDGLLSSGTTVGGQGVSPPLLPSSRISG